jgi:hypothetical protein
MERNEPRSNISAHCSDTPCTTSITVHTTSAASGNDAMDLDAIDEAHIRCYNCIELSHITPTARNLAALKDKELERTNAEDFHLILKQQQQLLAIKH